MADIITAVRGFKDILPRETGKWQFVEYTARRVFNAFGFSEIRIPIVEKTDLFRRGIGESTDIVEKEMYTFLDRGDEYLTLRPEATASVIRAFIEHSLYAADPVSRLYTIGPMFRRERPQKGRYRQFHQINVEALGVEDPRIDAEVILMLHHFLKSAGLAEPRLEINSLGCPECRPAFRKAITGFVGGREEGLCPDCRRRLQTNPLRVFDCKVETCKAIIADAPVIRDFICAGCGNHLDKVLDSLQAFSLPFIINPRMVRGLDYYTKTTFEITTDLLGAQNAVAGGGRYDGLVKDLGGPDIPGIGFAVGFERLVALLPPKEEEFVSHPDIFIAALGEEAQEIGFKLCNQLRMEGIQSDMDYTGKSLKSQMKRADKLGCRFTMIIGENEIAGKQAVLRNMKESKQALVGLDQIESIKKVIKGEESIV
jgi:histidyl-tRNA synthetase